MNFDDFDFEKLNRSLEDIIFDEKPELYLNYSRLNYKAA